MSEHDLGVTFDLGSYKIFSAIFETYFSCYIDIWIAITDYYMYFYLIQQQLLFFFLWGDLSLHAQTVKLPFSCL